MAEERQEKPKAKEGLAGGEEVYMPDEVLPASELTRRKVGEVVSPEQKGLVVYENPDAAMQGLLAHQEYVAELLSRKGELDLSNLTPEERKALEQGHLKAAITFRDANIAQNKAILQGFKAGSDEDRRKITEFNQDRIKGYGESFGEGSEKALKGFGKGLGLGVAHVIGQPLLFLGKGGLKLLEGGFHVAKVGFKKARQIFWDLWYGSWDEYNSYRNRYPKMTDSYR